MMTEKSEISECLRDLLEAHLEGVGFLIGALMKAMDGEISEDQRERFKNEICVMSDRNNAIRSEIG
jgi:hypothetical protein